MSTPRERGLRMPPEWAPHERTLMAWPCRRELWDGALEAARAEQAGVANAVAAFEPVTMVVDGAEDAAAARAALSAEVELLELPIDDSWLRDSGPIFVVDDPAAPTRRVGVHWGFNAWGGKFLPYDRDAEVGGRLVRELGDELVRAPMVLEGGSVLVDAHGTLITTEECLLHPNRNPSLDRGAIETNLKAFLGVERVVWLGRGLAEDRDTDGHVDLIAVPLPDGRLLLQSTPEGTPDHEPMAENHARAAAAGIEVVDFPLLAHGTVAGERVAASYLNLYLGERFAVVPLAGDPALDEEALARIAQVLPAHEVVGVPGLTLAWGGGGPHCITQQVPALRR